MTEYCKCLGCGATNPWTDRINGYCRVCYESTDTSGEKKNTKASGGVAISQLTRLHLQPIRRLMLETLRKYIKDDPTEMPAVEQIPFSELQNPLGPFLKE